MSTSLIPRPGVSLRRGADRHQTRTGWLHGRHSFDTGIDPLGADTHHCVLVVSNHDTIAPRSGFETHPHRNMEIVTWVLNGSLVHQDSEGHTGVIYPNLGCRTQRGPDLGDARLPEPGRIHLSPLENSMSLSRPARRAAPGRRPPDVNVPARPEAGQKVRVRRDAIGRSMGRQRAA